MILANQIGIDAYDIVETEDPKLIDHYLSNGYKEVVDINSKPSDDYVDISFELVESDDYYQRTWKSVSNGNKLVKRYAELKMKLQDTQDKLLYYSAFTSASALGIEGLEVTDYYDIKKIYEERSLLNKEIMFIEQSLGGSEEMQAILDEAINEDNDYIGDSYTRRTDLVSYYDTAMDFPVVGVENKLYVDTTNGKLYLYHNGYINVGNKSDWHDIELIDGNF